MQPLFKTRDGAMVISSLLLISWRLLLRKHRVKGPDVFASGLLYLLAYQLHTNNKSALFLGMRTGIG